MEEIPDEQFVKNTLKTNFPEGTAHVLPDIYKSRIKDNDPVVPDLDLQADPMFQLKKERKKKKNEKSSGEMHHLRPKDSRDRLKGEEAELAVIKQLQAALEDIPDESGLPSFILHNMVVKDFEVDVIILHPSAGVILAEVKALTNPRSMSRVDEAALQLQRDRHILRQELNREAARTIIFLPNLLHEDVEKTKGRCRKLDDGIELLCGKHEGTFRSWFVGPNRKSGGLQTYLWACQRWVLPICKESTPKDDCSADLELMLPLCHSLEDKCCMAMAKFLQHHDIGHFFYLLRAQHHHGNLADLSHHAPPHLVIHMGMPAQVLHSKDAWLGHAQRSICCLEDLCMCKDSHLTEQSLLQVAVGSVGRHGRLPMSRFLHHASDKSQRHSAKRLRAVHVPIAEIMAFCMHLLRKSQRTHPQQ